ncbi:hypothetical protein RN001_002918 [Aquatica leii]|uniref:Uncharacterized protein n=1 Tax=Aquatica leii TaxID=1421715 RepID=A0AAN7PHJ0_9COLE|nr:hypothetical protein RN001_002918 [Aquatica leii]
MLQIHGFILFSMLATSLATPEKQIKLEDIEDDNVKNDDHSKIQMKYTQVSNLIRTSPLMHYGFRPINIQQQQQQQQHHTQTHYRSDQQYYILPPQYTPPKYYAYPTNPLPQHQYQQEQLAYITNNHLPQQFHTPQYVFVNPDGSAVNPKFTFAYFQPQYVHPSQNIDHPQETSPTYQIQYVTVPQPQQQPQFQYKFESAPKHKFAPKSLLDSYIPSYLQVQYLKQEQARENAIRYDTKIPAGFKSDFDKNLVYRNVPANYHMRYTNYHTPRN